MQKHGLLTRIFSPLFALVLTMAGILLAGSTVAQEKVEPNIKAEADLTSPAVQAVQAISLAQQLAVYGRQAKSPEALAVAAQIVLDNPTREIEEKKQEEAAQDKPAKEAAKKSAPQPVLDAAKLLEEAKGMAAGNQTVLALIQQLQNRAAEKAKEVTRGRVGGAVRHYDSVSARTSDIYFERFRGGETAMVIVSGDGDTDLDLYIYDAGGNLIRSDTDATDDCVAVWTPAWTGRFKIVVKNLGWVYNNYVLVTN